MAKVISVLLIKFIKNYRNAASGDACAGHKSAMGLCSATFNRLKSSPDVILGGTDCKGSKKINETVCPLFLWTFSI